MENVILEKLQALYDLTEKRTQELYSLTLLGQKKALTMTDASLLTGLSKSHLYKCVCYKKIPYWKSSGGKYTYFDKDELTAWMLHNRIKTDAEIEQDAVAHIVTGKPKKSNKGGAR